MSLRSSLVMSLGFLLLLFLLVLLVGPLSWNEAVEDPSIIWDLRGSRALLAVAVGGSLAVSGALLQVLFSNPLCEPYTLGISSGSSLGAVIVGALGLPWVFQGVAIGALLGALIFMLPLVLLSSRGRVHGHVLLLAGVMLGFFGSSLVALVMALQSSSGVSQALLWLLGDLSRASSYGSSGFFLMTLIILLWILRSHGELDTLLLGEQSARSLGVEVDSLRRRILLASSALVALSVAFSGMVGFVGLMAPHFVRKFFGSAHHRVLPLSFIFGGIFVLAADFFSKIIFPIQEIPVGVITSLVGVPVYFVFVFGRGSRHV